MVASSTATGSTPHGHRIDLCDPSLAPVPDEDGLTALSRSSQTLERSLMILSLYQPLIQPYVPGEDWWSYYLDELAFAVDAAPSLARP